MDIGFLIHDDLYYGDPNDPLALSSGRWRAPLYKPHFNVQYQYVYTGDPTWNTEQLVRYYDDVTRKLLRYRVPLKGSSHYFWTKIYLKLDDEYVKFPWYSTIDDVTSLLAALTKATEGEVFYDVDDGWEIIMLARNGTLFLREWYSDANTAYSFDLALVQNQAHELLNRINPIMDHLRTALAADYWSYKLYSDLSAAPNKPQKLGVVQRFLLWYHRK
jgi:hypothetical protein